MAIGEVVTAELMGGMVFRFAEAAGTSPAAQGVVARLKDLNNLRPILNVFQWLDWFAGNEARKFYPLLHSALKQSLDGVVESALARRWDELKGHILPGPAISSITSRTSAATPSAGTWMSSAAGCTRRCP